MIHVKNNELGLASGLQRNGTSQNERTLAALNPAYVLVDERSTQDLLLFSQAFAKTLNYYNDIDQLDGDWSNFFPDDLATLVSAIDDLPSLSENVLANTPQPHLALFLTFIKLLQQTQHQLNDFTRRHLDFYYQQVLRLRLKQSEADYVHLSFLLAKGVDQFQLPKGTELDAGKDSLGNKLVYQTTQDILINRAQIAELKTLFVRKKTYKIEDIHQNPDILEDLSTPFGRVLADISDVKSERAFMAMLSMAVGHPYAGDELPEYPSTKRTPDIDLLKRLDIIIEFVSSEFFMTLPDFVGMMKLKEAVGENAWKPINLILENAGKARDKKFKFNVKTLEPGNIEINLSLALGRKSPVDLYSSLPEVENIYDLYRRRNRSDVKIFIVNQMYMTPGIFIEMMMQVENIISDWRRLYNYLRTAGIKRRQQYSAGQGAPKVRVFEKNKFSQLITRTLGNKVVYAKLKTIVRKKTATEFLDYCYSEIQILEKYFYMAAEDFSFIRKINKASVIPNEVSDWQRQKMLQTLETAHYNKQVDGRRTILHEKYQQSFDQTTDIGLQQKHTQAISALIHYALGDPNPGDTLPSQKQIIDLDSIKDESYITDNLYMASSNFQLVKNVVSGVVKNSAVGGSNANKKFALPDDDAWNVFYTIIEQSQRRKRGVKILNAELDNWHNIYVTADATLARTDDAAAQDTAARWRTFGDSPQIEDGTSTVTEISNVGFGITSPVLQLSEGVRTINLILVFVKAGFDLTAINIALNEKQALRCLISTAEEMIGIDYKIDFIGVDKTYSDTEQPVISLTLNLDEQAPAISALLENSALKTVWPEIHILLDDLPGNETDNDKYKAYTTFQPLVLSAIHLDVSVKGIRTLRLQNDDGDINSKKPFEIFGYAPVVGNNFYVSHAEICAKKLDTLEFDIDWLGVPDDLSSYYSGYSNYENTDKKMATPYASNTAFNANFSLINNSATFELQSVELFEPYTVQLPDTNDGESSSTNLRNLLTGASDRHTITIELKDIVEAYPAYDAKNAFEQQDDIVDSTRYWQFELNTGFMHAEYPRIAALNARRDPDPYIVNAPYTPKIKKMLVNYTASEKIIVTNADIPNENNLFYIEPFGARKILANDQGNATFLPQMPQEGQLFIGLASITPPINVSLLFQVAGGSADPTLVPADIAWDVLSDDVWSSPAQGIVVDDATNGFKNTGIIHFSLPEIESSQLMSDNLYWLRASVRTNSRSVGDMVAVLPQAVQASFVNQDNAPDHLDTPLAANTINALSKYLPEIKKINQPYSSQGGKAGEQADDFYTRISERLRHKNRVLTAWDYERMVLEKFPSIYKVKCIPAGSSVDPLLANRVQIIVIPNIKGKNPFDPFEPGAPIDLLNKIEKYLLGHSPQLARVIVKNPSYVQVKVRCGIQFLAQYDPVYYLQKLALELEQFLAPWAYEESAEILFNGSVNASLIINFLETRTYVDYIAGMKLFTSADGENFYIADVQTPPSEGEANTATDNIQEIKLLEPDVILVSAREHELDLIAEDSYDEELFSGINYMQVALDFQVAQENG